MIQFTDVSQTYGGGLYGVRNVSFTVNRGEFVFLTGPNGSGKTTLTKLITHEEKVSSGKLTVGKYNLHEIKKREVPYLRRSIGMVFQDLRLFENMTVYENVAFAMRVIGAHPALIRKRVLSTIEAMGLQGRERSYPGELSGGERQRVAFVRAIINNPSIIIADEPTGSIDRETSIEMMELLTELNANMKKVILVISHNDELVSRFGTRVIRMDNGCVAEDCRL